jgi:hypothetical protein
MSGQIIKRRHTARNCLCNFAADNGDVWQCSVCGRRWRYRTFPNPEFNGWRQTWPSLLGLSRGRP